MSFTEDEKRQWLANHIGGTTEDESEGVETVACSHCGIALSSKDESEFPLCSACD